MSDLASNTAPIKWAQRSDSLYLTIALSDVKDETIQLGDASLKFHGTSEGKRYEVDIEFYHQVNAEGSTYKVLPRSVQMHILKKTDDSADGDASFWPQLLKDKTLEKNQVKIDWDRYVDQDEEKEAGGFDTSALEGGMGMGGMGGMGMGGMGGMGGMDMEALMKQMGGMGGGMPGDEDDEFDDDAGDEEDLPDLEETK